MNATKRSLSLLTIGAASLLLVACDASKPPTVGERLDAGVERAQQAGTEAGQKLQAAGRDIREETMQAANAIADGTADTTITAKVKTALAGDDQLSALDINVDTRDKVVTLTGPAPSQVAVERATSLAKAVDGVTEVRNQLIVETRG